MIIDALDARIKNCKLTHFNRTAYGKAMKKLKDTHCGERCFLIGNGPSLRVDDLTVLHEKGEVSFAFNRIYQIFDATPWRPNFYISQDEKMLKGSIQEVSALSGPIKFVPIQLRWYYGIDIPGAQWFNLKNAAEWEGVPDEFSDDCNSLIYNTRTVMYTAAQLAAYMGFKEIYLIGVDHHFHTSMNSKGEIVIDPTAKDYFSDTYNADKENLYIPNTDKSTFTYIAMKEQCAKRNIAVYNATRGGKLEVFPRVDFDSLF